MHRGEVGVHGRGLGPGQQGDQRRQRLGAGDVLEARLQQQLAQPRLVRRVDVAVDQGHRRHAQPALHGAAGRRADRLLVQRAQHRPVGADALGHLQRLGVQRRRPHDLQREEIGPLLGPDAQQIAEPGGDEEGHVGPATLEQGVGPQRGGQLELGGGQRAAGGGPGDQPRGQQRRGLARGQLQHLVGRQGSTQRTREGDRAVCPGRRHLQRAAVVQRRAAGPGNGKAHQRPWSCGPADGAQLELGGIVERGGPEAHRAAAQDLEPVLTSVGVVGQAVGEGATGVDPELPGRRAHDGPTFARSGRAAGWSIR